MNERPEYESPSMTVIGTLHELTLERKFLNDADGVLFGDPAVNIGPSPV